MSSGIGFFCFATLSYSDCLCLLYKSQSLSLAKPFPSIYTTTPNGTSFFVLCSFSSLFCFVWSLAHTFHFLTLSFPYFHIHTVTYHFLQPYFSLKFSHFLFLSFAEGIHQYFPSGCSAWRNQSAFHCGLVFTFSICSLFIRSKNIYGLWLLFGLWNIWLDFGSGLWWEWWLCLYIQQIQMLMASIRCGGVCVFFFGRFPTYFLAVSF